MTSASLPLDPLPNVRAALRSTNVRAAQSLAAAFPGAAASVAARVWGRPRRYEAPRRESVWLEGATASRAPWRGGGLAVHRWGEGGPKVLLVHGWEGRASQMGAFAAPLVEAGFQVVAADMPGHGGSPGRTADLGMFAHAIGSLAGQHDGLAGIVAHSMGAASTLLALSMGVRAERAVLVAPADPSLAPGRFADFFGLPDTVKARFESRLEARYGVPLQHFAAERLAAHCPAPLLVVHDRHDEVVPVDDGERIARAAGAPIVHTERLGHVRILRDRGVTEQAVQFLTRRSS